MTSPVESLLTELKRLIQEVVELDLKEEANYSLLLSLEDRQKQCRDEVGRIVETTSYQYSARDKELLSECIQLQKEALLRFEALKNESEAHIHRINESRKSRVAYQGEYSQHVGFFIDSQQ